MDYQFPVQLFPSFYNCGPPGSVRKSGFGSWGCYDGVLPQVVSGSLSGSTFTSRYQVTGETWSHIEPVPVPLLRPGTAFFTPSTPPDPMDFTKHMQNFFLDHEQDAFLGTSELFGEKFREEEEQEQRQDSLNLWRVKDFLKLLNYKICLRTYRSRAMSIYSRLMADVVSDIPLALLGSLLHEELTEQKESAMFHQAATGGALAYVPFASEQGCLVYPDGLDCLKFHKVDVQPHEETISCVPTGSRHSFQLKAPIRQISATSLFHNCCVAVRTDHLCGLWSFSQTDKPRLLQVVQSKETVTCVSVSPHILGEVLVADEGGALSLWTVGRGVQRIRTELSNLYFNAKSAWRWCGFSAHPRVMTYTDRTGVELTDTRESPLSGHTLFRIGSTTECRSGERVTASRYLGDIHPFHHLVTTQHSVYIIDERFPCMHMLKYDHMMRAPPLFSHVLAGCGPSRTNKLLLGSHSSQEITLLQYSGGKAEACCRRGLPQALLRPSESADRLPVQIPHRRPAAAGRLAAPATGLACIPTEAGRLPGRRDSICVLQLTEAGDIFYQILEHSPAHRPPSPEAADCYVCETSSDDQAIGPTQAETVAETPEWSPRGFQGVSITELGSEGEFEVEDAGGPGPSVRLAWKRWLQKLARKTPRPPTAPLFRRRIKRPLWSPGERAAGLAAAPRAAARSCMWTRSLLQSRSDPAPVPAAAAPWSDSLSQRLQLAWRGEEAWRSWWEERLGKHRHARAAALRRRRRRQKEARRAAGQWAGLGASFTSASEHSELDDFSAPGWSDSDAAAERASEASGATTAPSSPTQNPDVAPANQTRSRDASAQDAFPFQDGFLDTPPSTDWDSPCQMPSSMSQLRSPPPPSALSQSSQPKKKFRIGF